MKLTREPLNRDYVVTMPNGEAWKVPVWVIVADRAQSYAEDDENDISYVEAFSDTLEIFHSNEEEIKDWARNNMNWEDVKPYAGRVELARDTDFQEGWVNGVVEIIG